MPNCEFSLKNSSLKCRLRFRQFCGRHKNNFPSWFRSFFNILLTGVDILHSHRNLKPVAFLVSRNLSLLIPSTLNFGKYRRNWAKHDTNGEIVIRVTQMIERILLLPWIQQIMNQVIQKYETNGFFVFRSVGSLSRQTDL